MTWVVEIVERARERGGILDNFMATVLRGVQSRL